VSVEELPMRTLPTSMFIGLSWNRRGLFESCYCTKL
jgi:hypothetical protein